MLLRQGGSCSVKSLLMWEMECARYAATQYSWCEVLLLYQDEQISTCCGSLFCRCCLRFALASRKLRLPWSLQSCNIRELPKHSCRQLCLPYPARLRSEVCRQWTQLQRTSPILSKQMTMILWCQGRSVWLRWQKFEEREVYGERGAQIMHKHAAQASLPVMPFGLALQTALRSSAVGALVEVWPGVAIPLAMIVLTCDASCFSATSYAKLFAEVAHADAENRGKYRRPLLRFVSMGETLPANVFFPDSVS